MLWHHYTGLIFGVLTLTWLLSGLLSVNPWGVFEGRSFSAEVQRIRGSALTYRVAGDTLTALETHALPEGTVRLEGSVLRGEPYFLAWNRDGSSRRLNTQTLRHSALPESAFVEIASTLRPGEKILAQGWLRDGDASVSTPYCMMSPTACVPLETPKLLGSGARSTSAVF